jgi:hypothetical protein
MPSSTATLQHSTNTTGRQTLTGHPVPSSAAESRTTAPRHQVGNPLTLSGKTTVQRNCHPGRKPQPAQ